MAKTPKKPILKGFHGELVIGPARVYLKHYWKDRGGVVFRGRERVNTRL